MRNRLKPLPDVLRVLGDQLRDEPTEEQCAIVAAALHVLADDFCLEKVVVLIPCGPRPLARFPRQPAEATT